MRFLRRMATNTRVSANATLTAAIQEMETAKKQVFTPETKILTSNGTLLLNGTEIQGILYMRDKKTNVSKPILEKIDRRLHLSANHPLAILRLEIETMLNSGAPKFALLQSMCPVVSTVQNFDQLLIPKDHPGRLPSDTYYLNSQQVLRTHTSAHQGEVLATLKSSGYLLTAGFVLFYRRRLQTR